MGQTDSKKAPLNRFINSPEEVSVDSIEGFLLTTPAQVAVLEPFPDSKVLIRTDWKKDRVAVVTCGGVGHEPADIELVGEGMLAAVACGRAWRDPTVDDIISAIAAVTGDQGCLLVVKNSFGGRLNVNMALERAERKLGYRVRVVYVSDDVGALSDGPDNSNARGIAGTVLVMKAAGAAAAAGLPLDEVYREAESLARDVASIGVAHSRGTAYIEAWSNTTPNDPDAQLEVGVGVHGEPGWMSTPATATAKDIVDLMIARLLPSLPKSGPVCVLLNNLGTVPRIEMAILAKQVMESTLAPRVELLAGPAAYYTALNTNGFSISVVPLTGRRQEWLTAATECRGWVAPVVPRRSLRTVVGADIPCEPCELPVPSDHPVVRRLLREVCEALTEAQVDLGSLSAKTGTGKLGFSLNRFSDKLLGQLDKLPMASPRQLFSVLSRECGVEAGVLFAFGRLILETAASELRNQDGWDLEVVVAALVTGAKEAMKCSGVALGRRTFLDALMPALACAVEPRRLVGLNEAEGGAEAAANGEDASSYQWRQRAAAAARRGARQTAYMMHASDWAAYTPLAQRAGFPDGGAVAVATIFTALATPTEGRFRRLPEVHAELVRDETHAEELARRDFQKYYELHNEVIGEGTFRRVRVGVGKQGQQAGEHVAISERRSADMEELGVKTFKSMLVMDKRRTLNWLFMPKPHIVKVFEVIAMPKSYYYVMEELQGCSLQELIESDDPPLYQRTREILEQILLGVQQLHSHRLIHRDIKPDNFLFDAEGVLKLVDVCGMLSHLSDSQEYEYGQGVVCGTLAYMSPEALSGASRQAADMWAVGVTLHLMLVGSMPYEACSVEEMKCAHRERVDLSSGSWCTVPPSARNMVERLLEFNARHRLTVDEALEFLGPNGENSPHWTATCQSSPCGSNSGNSPRRMMGTDLVTRRWRRPEMTCALEQGRITKTLYLIRHGEAVHNICEKAAMKKARQTAVDLGMKPGAANFKELVESKRRAVLHNPDFYDASLTDTGKLDALRAKCELHGLQDRGLPLPTVVLTSPLQRALQTAATIFPCHSCVHAREDLRERRTGLPCDTRQPAHTMITRKSFQQIDFNEVENLDNSFGIESALSDQELCVEDKAECAKRAAQFLRELATYQATDESHAVREHAAICIVTHKGYLRELERGALGNPEAAEFANCEVRVYEVTWSKEGLVEEAKCLYSNASLCTLLMRNFPAPWLDHHIVPDLPGKIQVLLSEFGELREPPEVCPTADGPQVNAVFEDQNAAAAAAKKLHGLDNRSEAERRARPTPHEADRFWARVLYDENRDRWTPPKSCRDNKHAGEVETAAGICTSI